MSRLCRAGFSLRTYVFSLLACIASLHAASFSFVDPLYHRLYPPPQPVRVRPIEGIDEHITNGKLHLNLRDFVTLVLRNSTEIHLSSLDVLTAADQITRAKSPFDPDLQFGFSAQRYVEPTFTQISGATILSSLTQSSSLQYQELLPSGQTLTFGYTGIRNSSNSSFNTFNPNIASTLAFNFSQPLLQNRTNLLYRAPLMIARTQLLITSERNEATIANLISSAVQQYWQAILARDIIRVQDQLLQLAQKSYDRDKTALDLGALPKLDIFQSESQVAQHKLDLVQAQYAYRANLDNLRHLIGADLRPDTRSIDVVLEDDPATLPLRTIDPFETALATALHNRPELSAVRRSISLDDLNARVARDQIRPQVNLNVLGGASGLGGNSVIGVIVPGGLGDSLSQMFLFNSPYYGAGLSFNLPFRNSAAQASLSDALVNKARDRYSERQTEQQVVQDVKQAINSLELAKAAIDAGATARELARKNVDAEQQKYELGGTTIFELLQAQNQLASVENSLVSAYVGYQTAYVQYERATWTLFDDYNIKIDSTP